MPGEGRVERRRANRRIRKSEFSSLGYYVVRFGPKTRSATSIGYLTSGDSKRAMTGNGSPRRFRTLMTAYRSVEVPLQEAWRSSATIPSQLRSRRTVTDC